MPYLVSVLAARAFTGAVPEEEAEIAELALSRLIGNDDLALDDLERDLRALGGDAPEVRVALVAQGEERERSLYVVEHGRVAAHPLVKAGRKWTVAGSAELSALVSEITSPKPRRTQAGAGAKRATASTQKAVLAAALASASRALAARDVPGMFSALESPELAGSAGAPLRNELWRTLIQRPAAPERQERFLVGLRDEDDASAHAIAYRLYIQAGLAPKVVAELSRAWAARPATRVYCARLCHAIREWPDFLFPDGFLAAADEELVAALDPTPKDPPSASSPAAVAAAIDGLLVQLAAGSLGGLRAARNACGEAKPATREKALASHGERLETAARTGEVAHRAAALETLRWLGASATTLASLTAGLPDTGWVRSLRLRANPMPLSVLRVREGYVRPPPAHDWRDVKGVARYPFGELIVSRADTAALFTEGKRRWRFTAKGTQLVPFRALGDSLPAGREVVFLGSKHGLHALDARTGSELWCNRTASHPALSGSTVDPNPQIWALPDRVWLIGSHEVQALDWTTGEICDVIGLPSPDTRGFEPHARGALIVDGPSILGTFGCADRVPTGLVLQADGSSSDQVVPAPLASIRRELDGIAVDVSALDLLVEAGGEKRQRALPIRSNEALEGVGAMIRGEDGALLLELAIHCDGVFGIDHWIAVEID